MIINIDGNYNALSNTVLLGYVGETNARTIEVNFPVVSTAELYKLRFELSNGDTYDVNVTDGNYTVDGSLLINAGTVMCQWLAVKASGEAYELIAKSNKLKLMVGESISDSTVPIPTYEEAVAKLDEVLALDGRAEAAADESEDSAESAANSATQAAEILEDCEMKSDLNTDVIAIGDARYERIANYELIETITIEEGNEPVSIARNQEPDGTPYNFKAMNVHVHTQASTGSTMLTIDYHADSTPSYSSRILRTRASNGISTSGSWYGSVCECRYGRWFGTGTSSGATSILTSLTAQVNVEAIGYHSITDYQSIGCVNVFSSDNSLPLPAGSTISIYAVRR